MRYLPPIVTATICVHTRRQRQENCFLRGTVSEMKERKRKLLPGIVESKSVSFMKERAALLVFRCYSRV